MYLTQHQARDTHIRTFDVAQDGIELAQRYIDIADEAHPADTPIVATTDCALIYGYVLYELAMAYDALRGIQNADIDDHVERHLDILEAALSDIATASRDLFSTSDVEDAVTTVPKVVEDIWDRGFDTLAAISTPDDDVSPNDELPKIDDAEAGLRFRVEAMAERLAESMRLFMQSYDHGVIYEGGYGPDLDEMKKLGYDMTGYGAGTGDL